MTPQTPTRQLRRSRHAKTPSTPPSAHHKARPLHKSRLPPFHRRTLLFFQPQPHRRSKSRYAPGLSSHLFPPPSALGRPRRPRRQPALHHNRTHLTAQSAPSIRILLRLSKVYSFYDPDFLNLVESFGDFDSNDELRAQRRPCQSAGLAPVRIRRHRAT